MGSRKTRTIKIGDKIGKRLVVSKPYKHLGYRLYCDCICDCGFKLPVLYDSLLNGAAEHCRCLTVRVTRARSITHGKSRTRINRQWINMIARCENPNEIGYKNYGGRGIKVCKRWHIFENFLADMGESKGLTLDRINNDKGYYKENCRWTDYKTQARNTRGNRLIEYKGITISVTEWAEKLGIGRQVINMRLKAGWSLEETFETPLLNRGIKNKIKVDHKHITFRNKTKSASEWAKELNINSWSMLRRLKKGWTVEEALTVPFNCNQNIGRIRANGKFTHL